MDKELVAAKQIDDKLLNMLKTDLHTEEQQQFVMNFQLYLTYGNNDSKYVVDLDDVWKWLGFASKGNAKRSLMKYCEKDIDFRLNSLVPRAKQHGGQNNDKIKMNVSTFKNLCMVANTERGKQTRRYYSKMEAIFFKYLEEKSKDIIKTIEERAKSDKELEIQSTLLKSHKNDPCVYILKLSETSPTNFVIKIGETDNIEDCIISLRQEYNTCILINVFPCQRPHQFEQYILHRKDVMAHRFMSSEIIKMSDEFTYDNFIKIIRRNIDNFNGLTNEQKIKMAELRLLEDRTRQQTELMRLISTTENVELQTKLTTIFEKMIVETQSISSDSKPAIEELEKDTIAVSNRRVYKYDIFDLNTPISTFYSLKEAARSLNIPTIHDYHIRDACMNNTVFNNYRWYYVDNEPELPATIPDTVEKQNIIAPKRTYKLIAQLNTEKTLILDVYSSQDKAAEAVNLSSCSICAALTSQKKCGNFFWKLYDECDDNLKSTFTKVVPNKSRPTTFSKTVQRIDPISNEVLETYFCIQDVCSMYRTCHKTIHKASKTGEIYKGFKWNITTKTM
jgi:phage anti-repressor protein